MNSMVTEEARIFLNSIWSEQPKIITSPEHYEVIEITFKEGKKANVTSNTMTFNEAVMFIDSVLTDYVQLKDTFYPTFRKQFGDKSHMVIFKEIQQ